MFLKILNLFFSKKGRIGDYDYFILFAIWIILFSITIVYLLINISSFSAGVEYDSLIFISKTSINIIILLSLFYSGHCLGLKRAHDLGFSKLPNTLKNIIKQFQKGNKEENEFGKSKVLFNFSYITKLISIIIFCILFLFMTLFYLKFIDNKIESLYNSNVSVVESKKKILNNSELKVIFGNTIDFGKINGFIINNKSNGVLSISYNIIGNNNQGLVKVEGKKEKGIWLINTININIGGKEYNIH